MTWTAKLSPQLAELYPSWTPERCRDCPAEVLWCVSTSGKRMPIDAEPAARGNVMLMKSAEPVEGQLGVLAVVLSGPALQRAKEQVARLYTSHHMTCPNGPARRKATKKS